MRLTCPNCNARYDVDDSLVPPEGRDVQCSNCATTWFQPGKRTRREDPEDSGTAPTAPRRDLDPALRDILREEREREEQLRRAAATVEEQEEMALDQAPAPRAQDRRPNPPEEADAEAAAIRQMVEEAQAPEASRRHGGRELFPDIEQINSTLRPTSDRNAGEETTSDIETMDRRPRRKRGFRIGFFLMVFLAAAAIAAYSYAPEITAALPQAEPVATTYVAQVNDLRFRLDDAVQSLVARLGALAGM